jgi:hypothetical protein
MRRQTCLGQPVDDDNAPVVKNWCRENIYPGFATSLVAGGVLASSEVHARMAADGADLNLFLRASRCRSPRVLVRSYPYWNCRSR